MSEDIPASIIHPDFQGNKLDVFRRRFVSFRHELQFGYIATLPRVQRELQNIDPALSGFEHEDGFLTALHIYEAEQNMPGQSGKKYPPDRIQQFDMYTALLRQWHDAVDVFLKNQETWRVAFDGLLKDVKSVQGSQELVAKIEKDFQRIATRSSDFQQVIGRHMPSRQEVLKNFTSYISRVGADANTA